MQTVISLLTTINTDRTITVHEELRTLDNGTTSEVETVTSPRCGLLPHTLWQGCRFRPTRLRRLELAVTGNTRARNPRRHRHRPKHHPGRTLHCAPGRTPELTDDAPPNTLDRGICRQRTARSCPGTEPQSAPSHSTGQTRGRHPAPEHPTRPDPKPTTTTGPRTARAGAQAEALRSAPTRRAKRVTAAVSPTTLQQTVESQRQGLATSPTPLK